MQITKYSFYLTVIIYMVLFGITNDLVGNTNTTGLMAKWFLLKFFFDIVLALVAIHRISELARGRIVKRDDIGVGNRVKRGGEVLETTDFGVTDAGYYLMLVVYVGWNCWWHIEANADTTGLASVWYALWAVVDVFIMAVAAHQAYLKIGGIEVRLRPKANA